MVKAVVKTLAIAFGGGLALGAGIRLGQGSARARKEHELDPVLTRLESVEGRIVRMESAARAGVPSEGFQAPPVEANLVAFESRLAAQVSDVDRLRTEIRTVDRKLGELDSRLPLIVQANVNARFQEVELKLRNDFEQVHGRSMEAFVQTLHTTVVERMSTLESNLAEQSEVIGKLRETSLKTDQNLQKMLAGIQKLCDQSQLPARPLAAETSGAGTGAVEPATAGVPAPAPLAPVVETLQVETPAPPPVSETPLPAGAPEAAEENYEWVNRIGLELLAPRPKPSARWRLPLVVGLILIILIAVAGAVLSGVLQIRPFSQFLSEQQASTLASTGVTPEAGSQAPGSGSLEALQQRLQAKPGDVSTLVELSQEYVRRKDWAKAENAYRSLLEASPDNRDAALGLSDVLYQQQKYEESAAVLNKLSAGKAP